MKIVHEFHPSTISEKTPPKMLPGLGCTFDYGTVVRTSGFVVTSLTALS